MQRLQTMFKYFQDEILYTILACVVAVFFSISLNCAEDVIYAACPDGYQSGENGSCVKISDGELECGATRTFQINYLDARTKTPIIYPVATTLTNIATRDDSNGRRRINDPEGVYIYEDILLCDEYQLSATVACYENLDRADFLIPLSTIWTIELQPKDNCTDNDLELAFATCMDDFPDNTQLCCEAFRQTQFDLTCGRF